MKLSSVKVQQKIFGLKYNHLKIFPLLVEIVLLVKLVMVEMLE